MAIILLLLPQTGHADRASWYYRLALQGGGFIVSDGKMASDEMPIGPLVGPEHTFLWEVNRQHQHLLGFSGACYFGFFFTDDPGTTLNINLSLAYWYQIRGQEAGDGPYFRFNFGLTAAEVNHKSDEEKKKEAFIWMPYLVIGPSLKIGWGYGWPLHPTVRFTMGANYELGIGVLGNVINALYLDLGFLF